MVLLTNLLNAGDTCKILHLDPHNNGKSEQTRHISPESPLMRPHKGRNSCMDWHDWGPTHCTTGRTPSIYLPCFPAWRRLPGWYAPKRGFAVTFSPRWEGLGRVGPLPLLPPPSRTVCCLRCTVLQKEFGLSSFVLDSIRSICFASPSIQFWILLCRTASAAICLWGLLSCFP